MCKPSSSLPSLFKISWNLCHWNHLRFLSEPSSVVEYLYISLILPTGGPPYSESPYRHRHAGCHFKGNTKSLLCYHLQAGGQHQWGGLDGLQAWQESQGRLRIVHRHTPKKIIWMLLGDKLSGKIHKKEYIHHMSWPQTTNVAVDYNYSLSTILHLASIRALQPSQIQQITPSDTLHRRLQLHFGPAFLVPSGFCYGPVRVLPCVNHAGPIFRGPFLPIEVRWISSMCCRLR